MHRAPTSWQELMETQGLDTIPDSPSPALRCYVTLFGFLPPWLPFFFISSFPLCPDWPTHVFHPSHPCCQLWSLPADVLIAPCTTPGQHSTGDSGKGAKARQEPHRDKPPGNQVSHSDKGSFLLVLPYRAEKPVTPSWPWWRERWKWEIFLPRTPRIWTLNVKFS